jgi:D-alanyl-D-alanine carboxypeptidase
MRLRTLLNGLAVTIAATTASAQAGPAASDFEAVVRKAGDAGVFSGSVLVAQGGSLIYSGTYGYADRAARIPVATDTKFLLASVTKQFTASMILRLVDAGKLSVEELLSARLPGLPQAWKGVRVRHLLTHTSGIYDYLNSPDLDQIRYQDLKPSQIVDRFRAKPLNFTPGTQSSYSNSGFLLLGMLYEKLTGLSLHQAVTQEILGPAGMTESGFEPAENLPEPFATGYRKEADGSWIVPPGMHPSILFGVGDLYATVGDLWRWNRLLTQGPLLTDATRAQMFTARLGGYGYGVRVNRWLGRREISHTGHVTGFSNFIGHYVDDDVCVVVLSNLINAPAMDIGRALARVQFEDGKAQVPDFKLVESSEMRE